MKKVIKKTAIILLIVMIMNAFTGCLSWWLMTGEWPNYGSMSGEAALGLIFIPVIDIILLPVALIVFTIRMAAESARKKRGERLDGIDTFSAIAGFLSEKEIQSLMKKFESVSDKELELLAQRFFSLSDKEIESYTKTVNSLSASKFSIIVNAVSNSSETRIFNSIETLNSVPDEKFITTVNNLQNIKLEVNYEN